MISSMNYSHLFKQPQSGAKPAQGGQTQGASDVQGERGTQATAQVQGLENNPKFQAFKATRNAEVMAHEQAHASAAGAFGGSIHIDYDQNGVATGGHVPISMPAMDSSSPDKTASHAQTVINAATAPGSDMSGQDASVAAQAQSILGQAQVLMGQKKVKPS